MAAVRGLSDEVWAEVERKWSADEAAVRALAREYGVSPNAIRKRAARDGWIKDSEDASYTVRSKARTAADIKAAQESIVEREKAEALAKVKEKLANEHEVPPPPFPSEKELEAELVNIASTIIGHHRKQLANAQELIDKALAKLKEKLEASKSTGELSSLAKSIQSIVASLTRTIELERRAWRIEDDTGNKTYEDALEEIYQRAQEARRQKEQEDNGKDEEEDAD